MASIYRRKYLVGGVQRTSPTYTIKYRDENGKWIRVKGFKSKEKTRILAAKLEVGAADGPDPFAAHGKRLLTEHVADFRKSMEAKNRSAQHVDQTCNRIEAIFTGCGFQLFADIDALKIENWLVAQRNLEMGIKTSNYYTKAAKQFAKWMLKNKRAAENPTLQLEELNANVDVRVQRRALTPDAFERLTKAAQAGKPFRSISGPNRAMLYLLASTTGLRASELHSLTDQSFDLEPQPATLTVQASDSKHKEKDVVPLRADIVPILKAWLPKGQLWPGTWHKKAAPMIYRDMEAARKTWLKEVEGDERAEREKTKFLCPMDEAGKVFDFHALRGQFVTSLARAGVHPKTAQKLARHKTLALTMANYTHADMDDMAAAVNKLPSQCVQNVPTVEDISCRHVSSPVIACFDNTSAPRMKKPLRSKGLDTVCHPLSSDDINEAVGTRTQDLRIKSRPAEETENLHLSALNDESTPSIALPNFPNSTVISIV